MDRTTLISLNESLLEPKVLPKGAKATLDKIVARKINRVLGLDLTRGGGRESFHPAAYTTGLTDKRGKNYILDIVMMRKWKATLEYYPFGYSVISRSRARSELIGVGEGDTVNDALNNMKKPVSESFRGDERRSMADPQDIRALRTVLRTRERSAIKPDKVKANKWKRMLLPALKKIAKSWGLKVAMVGEDSQFRAQYKLLFPENRRSAPSTPKLPAVVVEIIIKKTPKALFYDPDMPRVQIRTPRYYNIDQDVVDAVKEEVMEALRPLSAKTGWPIRDMSTYKPTMRRSR